MPKKPDPKLDPPKPTGNLGPGGNVIMNKNREMTGPRAPEAKFWDNELKKAQKKANDLEDEGGQQLFEALVLVVLCKLWFKMTFPTKPEYATDAQEAFERANSLHKWITEEPRTDQKDIVKMKEDGLELIKILKSVDVSGLTKEHVDDILEPALA